MAEKNPLLQAAENIGAILKARREDIDKSQREIAEALGYRNINFISMIESGRSNPPLARAIDICNAYELPYEFVPLMVRELYPDTWQVILAILNQGKEFFANKTPAQLEKALDKQKQQWLKDYHITT